jgi:3-isopropylmalate dehydrogenase
MEKKIAVINGDGIGPEVTAQSIKVLNAIAEEFGHQFTYTHGLMGAVSIDATGSALPLDETLAICKESDAFYLAPLVILNLIMIPLLK